MPFLFLYDNNSEKPFLTVQTDCSDPSRCSENLAETIANGIQDAISYGHLLGGEHTLRTIVLGRTEDGYPDSKITEEIHSWNDPQRFFADNGIGERTLTELGVRLKTLTPTPFTKLELAF